MHRELPATSTWLAHLSGLGKPLLPKTEHTEVHAHTTLLVVRLELEESCPDECGVFESMCLHGLEICPNRVLVLPTGTVLADEPRNRLESMVVFRAKSDVSLVPWIPPHHPRSVAASHTRGGE